MLRGCYTSFMGDEKLFYIGVKGLVENAQSEILLLLADVSKHRKNVEPYWDIPGGRIKGEDSVLETLRREIEEETGIADVQNPTFLTAVVSNHRIPLDGDDWAGLLLMVYKVTTPNDSKITISEEHSNYEWVEKAGAKRRLSHKYPPEFIDQL